MDIVARIDELVRRGFDNGLISAITGVDQGDVADFRLTRVPPQDPMAGGGGGSSFDHLSEVADHGGYIHADERIIVSVDDPYASFSPGTFIGTVGGVAANVRHADTEVFSVYDVDGVGNYAVWQANGDGSLAWSDGTHPPDIHMARAQYPDLTIWSNGGSATLGMVRLSDIENVNSGVSSSVIGDADTGGVEVALGPEKIGDETWPFFMLTDYTHYNNPIWGVYPSGKMAWSAPDGASAPDVFLGRTADGNLSLNTALNVSEALTTGPEISVGPDQLGIYSADGAGYHEDIWAAQWSDTAPRFALSASDGSLHWSDGVNPPDKSLLRTSDGLIVRHDAGKPFFVTDDAALSGSYAALYGDTGSLELSDDAGHTVALAAASVAGFVRNPTHGGGVQLHSLDGTAYNVTVTNDGTLDIAAA